MKRWLADAQHDVGSSGNGKLLYRLFLNVIPVEHSDRGIFPNP